jgi:hypothetical protein
MHLAKTRNICGVAHVFCAAKGEGQLRCDGYASKASGGYIRIITDCAHRGANSVCTCQIINSAVGGTGNGAD